MPVETAQDRLIIRDQILRGEYTKQDAQSSIKDLVEGGEFVKAIQQLRLEKDNANGVNSFYASPNCDREHTILIRNTTNQQETPKDSYHDWAIMGLNYASAAKKLAASHGQGLDNLSKKAAEFFAKIETSSDPEIDFARFVNSLVPLLKEKLPALSKKEIQEQLADVRDFCNFEHQTISVATKIAIPYDPDQRFIIQIDIPTCGNMPKELEDEYKALAEFNRCNLLLEVMSNEELQSPRAHELLNEHRREEINKISWYQDQPSHIQHLILFHAKDILEGKTIPTQLRKYFPNLRNGFEEFIELVDRESTETLQHHYHSGTPGHLLGDTELNQTATNQSLQQLKNLTGAEHVLTVTLLSPINPMSDDAALVRQVENASTANSESFHTCNIPLNYGRLVESNRLEGAQWLYNEAQKALTRINDDDPNFKKLLSLLTAYDDLRSGSGVYDPENRNLQLASVIARMAHTVNQIHRKNFVAISTSCQSGKDRTGILDIEIILAAIKSRVALNANEEKSITRKIIAATGLRAGLPGGTIGASGIKKDTKPALPKRMKNYINDIFKDTASHNKKIPKNPDKQRPLYRNPRFWLALGGLVLGAGLCATGIGALAGSAIAITSVTTLTGAAALSTAVLSAGITAGVTTLAGSIYNFIKAQKENRFFKRTGKVLYTQKSHQSPAETKAPVEVKAGKAKHENETPMTTVPFPTRYLSPIYQPYQELEGPIVYTPEIIKEICEKAANVDLNRVAWVIVEEEQFIENLKEHFKLNENLTLKEAKTVFQELKEKKLLTMAERLNSILYRMPQLENQKVQNISVDLFNDFSTPFYLSESKNLAEYTKNMRLAIPNLTEDEAHALFTPKFAVAGRYEQGGIVNAHAKTWACICVELGVFISPAPTTTIAITRNSNGSFTIKSAYKAKSAYLAKIENEMEELKESPFQCSETYTLKKNKETNNWELSLHPESNNLQVHPTVWAHMLEQAGKKLNELFSLDDESFNFHLFVFIPFLSDKNFTAQFQKNLSKIPAEKHEKLLELIRKYHGENPPEHIQDLLKEINAKKNPLKAPKSSTKPLRSALKAPPEHLQTVQSVHKKKKKQVRFAKDLMSTPEQKKQSLI